MSSLLDRRLQALSTARACAMFGARLSTIEHLSGLPQPEFRHLAFPTQGKVPRGRIPTSVDWLHRRTSLLEQAEAAVIMTTYRRMTDGGFPPSEALLGAYAYYRDICEAPYRIILDRAFTLASNMDGIWLVRKRCLQLVRCSACGSEHIGPIVSDATNTAPDCPFCPVIHRYLLDPRLQARFPHRPQAAAADLHLSILALMRKHPLHLHPVAHTDGERVAASACCDMAPADLRAG